MNNRLTHVILLIVCVALTFGRLCTSKFTVLDDDHTITANRDLNPPTLTSLKLFWTRIGPETPGSLYIPVTYTAWAGLANLAQQAPDPRGIRLKPWIFHAANVIVHSLAAITVYALLNLLTSNGRAALLGALFYALHPVMVEPVGWISGLKDLLAGCLTLLSLYLYCRSRQVERDDPGRMLRYVVLYVSAMLLFVIAMLSKPSAVVAPLLALAIDRTVFDRSWRTALLTLLPWFLLAIVCAAIARWTQLATHVRAVPFWVRPLVAGDNLAFYIRQIVFPLKLGFDYGRYPTKLVQSPFIYVAWMLPAAIGYACWMFRKRAPLLLLGASCFVAGLLPVLGFVSFQFQAYSGVADHYLYVPMFGVAILVAWLMSRLPGAVATTVMAVILVALAARSFVQTAVWKDSFTLFTHMATVNPESHFAFTNLAYDAQQRKDWDKAIEYTERALPLGRNLVIGSYENLAIYLIHKGDIRRAIEVTDQAIQERHASPMQLRRTMTKRATTLGMLFQQKGYPDQARRLFEVVKQDAPHDVLNNLAIAELERSQRRPPATTQSAS